MIPAGWKESGPGWIEKTVQVGRATVTIRRPILTDEERANREQSVIRTLKTIAGHTGI